MLLLRVHVLLVAALGMTSACSPTPFAELDTAPVPEADSVTSADAAARRDEGVLFAGTSSTQAGRRQLTVAEAYTPFPSYPPVRGKLGDLCGSRGLPWECADGLFCKRLPAANCGRSDVPGTCSVQPTICYELYKPVCGCDGVTYGNECKAWAAGISVDYAGPCV